MTYAVFAKNHITLAGNRYFVANAEILRFGAIGKKATPLFGQNKLEPKDHVPPAKLDGSIQTVPPISIDTSTTKEDDFMATVSASLAVIGLNVSGGQIYEQLASNKLKLVELFVEEEDMVRAVNDSPKVLQELASYGADARIVCRQLIAVEAKMAEKFTAGPSFNVSVDVAGVVSIKTAGGSSTSDSTVIRLGANTCLGYLLLNFSWNDNKTRIQKPRIDEYSFS
jgi:hypothetical protein